jgi:hypothetical protein
MCTYACSERLYLVRLDDLLSVRAEGLSLHRMEWVVLEEVIGRGREIRIRDVAGANGIEAVHEVQGRLYSCWVPYCS